MKILVKYFAIFRDKTGKSQEEYIFETNITIRDLKKYITGKFPLLISYMPNAVAAINYNFAMDDEVIPENAEVAIFPPVSGGSGFKTVTQITAEPISVDEVTASLTQPTTGAVCAFTGIVRAETNFGKFPKTSWLEYEAYPEMAVIKLKQIAEEIRQKWPMIESVAIIQRVGRINPGTPSVLVACTGAHRNAGIFEGAQYGINRVKEILPVWKKEISPNGDVWIEGNYHPGKGD